jgi:hypothetical protein
LASLIPYYLFVYLIRDRLRETFSFVVEWETWHEQTW